MHINWKDKRMQDFMMDSHKLLGWGLIALGGHGGLRERHHAGVRRCDVALGPEQPLLPRGLPDAGCSCRQMVVCVALIVCGVWLVRGPKGKKVHRKKAEEPEDEDFREYTAAEADAPEAPEETADFAMPKLSALLGDPVTPEDPDEPEQPENAEGDDGRTE